MALGRDVCACLCACVCWTGVLRARPVVEMDTLCVAASGPSESSVLEEKFL